MKVYATSEYSVDWKSTLKETEAPKPAPSGHDILVKIKAVSTNPVDCKKLSNFSNPSVKLDAPLVVGWDAAGIVEQVGNQSSKFKVGDEVYFAGSLIRAGCFAEYVLVDERIAALKPSTLSWTQAAALPLTSLTAYELFFRSMHIPLREQQTQKPQTILLVGGAGGVGSIGIQLAKLVFGLTVIATASRPDSSEWCKRMGADHVITHYKPMAPQIKDITGGFVDYVATFADLTPEVFPDLLESVAPYGKIGFITAAGAIPPGLLMSKSVSLHAELMFTPSITGAAIEKQGEILEMIAKLVDQGLIKTTANVKLEFNLKGLIQALELQHSGKAIGKITLE